MILQQKEGNYKMNNVYKMARYKMALESIYSIVDLENYPKIELIKNVVKKALCCDEEILEDDCDDVDR